MPVDGLKLWHFDDYVHPMRQLANKVSMVVVGSSRAFRLCEPVRILDIDHDMWTSKVVTIREDVKLNGTLPVVGFAESHPLFMEAAEKLSAKLDEKFLEFCVDLAVARQLGERGGTRIRLNVMQWPVSSILDGSWPVDIWPLSLDSHGIPHVVRLTMKFVLELAW